MKDKTEDIARDLLLSGKRITKFDFLNICGSACLQQRIKDIRYKTDWDIKFRSVPGKGTLREYWLEPSEIERIKSGIKRDEQSLKKDENIAPQVLNEPKTEKIEQLGFGLLGGHNYG